MPRPQLLIVEDDPGQVQILQAALKDAPVEVQVTDGVAAALRVLSQQRFHAVLCDLVMPEGGGQAVLRFVRHQGLTTPVIIVTGYGDEESLTDCLAAGAFDFLSKPVERFTLCAVLRRALLRNGLFCEENFLGPARRSTSRFPTLVGTSPAMQDVYERMAKVAAVDATVCLGGESGTGKELVARAIHAASPRASRPFLVLDCAAIPEGLLESELFGHVKGAFTSAASNREGLFQLADGGTLLLDEVAELPLAIQPKLLRVLQCREFRPVGGRHSIRVNVRLIAATHQDLRARVQARQFREDLFYRLDVVPLALPPLRARSEDIPLLVEHFLTQHNRRNGKQLRGVSARTMAACLRYHWPGNVRELEHCIERAAVLAEQDILDIPDLTPLLHPPAVGAPRLEQSVWPRTLEEAERALIRQTLQGVQGNRTRAADLLGISLRGLHYKLKTLDLVGERLVSQKGTGGDRRGRWALGGNGMAAGRDAIPAANCAGGAVPASMVNGEGRPPGPGRSTT
jgi:two-component system response regulator AtoC